MNVAFCRFYFAEYSPDAYASRNEALEAFSLTAIYEIVILVFRRTQSKRHILLLCPRPGQLPCGLSAILDTSRLCIGGE